MMLKSDETKFPTTLYSIVVHQVRTERDMGMPVSTVLHIKFGTYAGVSLPQPYDINSHKHKQLLYSRRDKRVEEKVSPWNEIPIKTT